MVQYDQEQSKIFLRFFARHPSLDHKSLQLILSQSGPETLLGAGLELTFPNIRYYTIEI